MKKQETIKWKCIEVDITKIKPTPNNFKLWDEEGAARFRTSIDKFGRAGTVILNADYTLVDGNTRIKDAEKAKVKKVWASIPSRLLKPKEFIEMAAMIDHARAGQVDIVRIKEELGTTKSFFKEWGIPIDDITEQRLQELDNGKITPNKGKALKDAKEVDVHTISLIFTPEEAKKYLAIAESLYKTFKVDNVTDLAMKVILFAKVHKK